MRGKQQYDLSTHQRSRTCSSAEHRRRHHVHCARKPRRGQRALHVHERSSHQHAARKRNIKWVVPSITKKKLARVATFPRLEYQSTFLLRTTRLYTNALTCDLASPPAIALLSG
jgi:hypothetical protein